MAYLFLFRISFVKVVFKKEKIKNFSQKYAKFFCEKCTKNTLKFRKNFLQFFYVKM